ncbi:MAG: hypothetical protein MJ252_15530, partial [archaeon]|nr:hypothetical protein [archaeon]
INPDPSSTYPMPGRGYVVDNVLQVENKEHTVAKDTVYYAVIPLVSPLVDGVDQAQVATYLEFDNDYYLRHGANKERPVGNFSVPWVLAKEGSEDAKLSQAEFIDFAELSGHGITTGADWDQPVKIVKKSRTEYPGAKTYSEEVPLNVKNAGYSTTINNTQMLLEQIYFENSDKFYEVGTQRLMSYVDIQTEEGLSYFYEGKTAPTNRLDPDNTKRSKKTVIFSRSDIYFYDKADLQNPSNVTGKTVISIDKYPKPSASECKESMSTYVQNEGYFDHTKGGLKPNEWVNMMFTQCNYELIDPTASKVNNPSSDIKFIHYLVPVVDESIKRAGNLMDFTENSDKKTGYLTEYPIVKFIYAHGTTISIPADQSRQGGRLSIKLPTDIKFNTSDPITNDYVTYSADQVAFYKTTYDSDKNIIYVYFKRGLMPNEAYGQPSIIEINLENLNTQSDFTCNIGLEEVKYDISSKETEYEKYETRKGYSNQKFIYKPYYHLPAVEISNRLERKKISNETNEEEISTELLEYELMMPYSRIGVYQQELLRHRTVYSYLEIHNVKDPGLVSNCPGFALVSNIGTSSIPTVEFLTHGTGLLIPAAARTSRLEWTDIWGRKWAQPLRSVFPDIPPIPPPLKDFVMSTTYALMDSQGQIIQEWPSDERISILVQLKFLNNYPKYFLPITCKENMYPYVKEKLYSFKNDRVFTSEPDFEVITEKSPNSKYWASDYYVAFGFSSVYGKCYNSTDAKLSGSKLTQSDIEKIGEAMTCSATEDAEKIKECENKLTNLKTLSRNPDENDTSSEFYNYSPLIENFYPKGYINKKMWDLTHYDYDDNAMDKGYRYHNDNNLPSLDVCPPQNPAYYKPHNVVTFPLFKGFGYSMTYSSSSWPTGHGFAGWTTDNLQNKDDTILAGQNISNPYSVGAKDYDIWWRHYKDLNDTESPYIKDRLKNIYVCKFNPYRINMRASMTTYAFPDNVYINNVIPIFPDMTGDDKRLTEYNCTDTDYVYRSWNISQVDNRVRTVTDRDWLYFAVNLRGGAKENIKIGMTIAPISSDIQYEGITKVQDGGRFVYWNPVNGPNSFLMLDNPVNNVEAYRVDLTLDHSVTPSTITTFNGDSFLFYKVEDPNEILREYTMNTYTNSYGFGDSTITVSVGGVGGNVKSTCKLNRGDTTYIKIAFYNNCGFDWNLKGKGIDFEYKGSQPINANDLLYGLVHTIQKPLKYNFMILDIPEEIKNHIEIEPSDHNIYTPPQFFDFENINVVTIRDGFEGDYFYKL